VRVAFFGFGLVYLAWIVGWGGVWIRVAALAALVSLEQRNILINNGGSEVLSVLLVWCLFLPLDEYFSVTSWTRGKRDPTFEWSPWGGEAGSFTSLAYFGAIWSLALIYTFNALSKTGDTWSSGQALHYALNVSPMMTHFGLWARTGVGEGVKWLFSTAALDIEIVLPFLILAPALSVVCRGLAIACILALHGGIALTLVLGIFPVILPVYGLLLICPEYWSWLLRRLHAAPAAPVLARTDGPRTLSIVGSTMAIPLFYAMTVQAWAGYAATGPAHVRPYKAPAWTDAVSQYTHAVQLWKMFAPDVPTTDYAIVVEGAFADGTHRDLVSGKPFDRGVTTDLNQYFDAVQNLDAFEGQWELQMNEAFFRGNPSTLTYYGRYWFKKFPDLQELWILTLKRETAGVGQPQTKDVMIHLAAEITRGAPGQFLQGEIMVRQAGSFVP
jgi:hypothetical protein